mmetsp:Transcript_4335/g.13935  ORF Transcript_4335/g.13935 Transcript_4335/m.13935 type:complete len:286 (-) Transcript_4335:385-1242(-)|eukprot:CAMPEP_0182905688 /NCGR_PEP_ID=MMETSP0034_2-20130328/33133_1 /TAXON_ID=156128 /ORGANISM="Nephroselmis pyriformis, Strain CCMP717" /LENGTH=285 /DNA_ID=CAMNT_0025041163 /DNA_START=229 /DNA_END=1086 /DNA_ORIENTATION=+
MGCCMGKEASGAEQRGVNNLSKNKDNRANTWRATGIVSLRDGNIKEIPGSALDLGPAVKNLDAHNNAITFLPPSIGDCTKMTRLVLSSNRLPSLPSALGQLTSLKILILDNNALSSLPPALSQLSKLEKLSVNGNSLTSLPTSMSSLIKLTFLAVSNNKLTELPASLGDCGALEEVEAADNSLTAIPRALGALTRLKRLNLDNNSIPTVPEEVYKGCSSLITLSLHGNPVDLLVLQKVPGYDEFEARRADKHGRQIQGGVMIGSAGLDTGVDVGKPKASNYLPHT